MTRAAQAGDYLSIDFKGLIDGEEFDGGTAEDYEFILGEEDFTVLEICYSIGLFLGIMIFFNHLGRKKITHDPTPIQVEMRTYEKDVDTTFIENCGRKGNSNDVD